MTPTLETPVGSPVPLFFLVPIVGFLTALAGMLWQRRIARQAAMKQGTAREEGLELRLRKKPEGKRS